MKLKRVVLGRGKLITRAGAYSVSWESANSSAWKVSGYPEGRLIFEFKEKRNVKR